MMPTRFRAMLAAWAMAVLAPSLAAGQGANVAFGGIRADTGLPVEVTADSLTVDQGDGTALFAGNVLIAQGDMRLSANEVLVEYAQGDTSKIERLHATGGVTLASGAEAAEASEAIYTIDSGEVVMTGDVLLTQGGNTLTGQKLTVDLSTGSGRMDGRVRTILNAGEN